MNTLDKVVAEHRDLVGTFPSFGPGSGSLAAFRKNLSEGFQQLLPAPTVAPQELQLSSVEGTVRALLFRPSLAVAGAPAIVYLHGGGMVAGTADMMNGASAQLAEQAGAVVLAVDYRLAPETPFPGGLEDCYAGLMWLFSNATELGVDAGRISVMGDSGGGGLAAGLALLARDRGMPPLRSQILLYPMLDLRTGSNTGMADNPNTGEFVWTRGQNVLAWQAVRGGQHLSERELGYMSPALAVDLGGLPPTYILAGSMDLFVDEDIIYAQRLLRAGVPVDLTLCAGAVHGFDRLPGALGERAAKDIQAALLRLL